MTVTTNLQHITVVIYTRNEQDNITECIQSAQLLHAPVIVIDMQSTDETVARARRLGASVYEVPLASYVEVAREAGIQKAHTPWVVILDADERITHALAHEIEQKITSPPPHTHYKIPRKNMFGKKHWLTHGGWYPDYQIRLIKKTAFISWPKQIHSTVQIKGEFGCLIHPLMHYFHPSLEQMVEKTIVFEDIESALLYKARKHASVLTFFRKFLGECMRRLIIRKGFLDGTYGIIESLYQAFSKTITYLFLYEKNRDRRSVS